MPIELERIAFLEAKTQLLEESMERIRNHISELLTFKSRLEGAMKLTQLMIATGLLGNLVMLLKLFFGRG